MRKNQSAISIGQRAPLITQPLFLEGITRAGKFLLANVVNGFQDIEPVQYFSLLENIPYLAKHHLVDEHTAQQIMQCEIDLHSYEMMIGRNLNHRQDDKSSVFNTSDHHQYLMRCQNPDVLSLIADFHAKQKKALYILHETMPQINFLFETFPQLQMISLKRHPVDLVYSWYKRGHGSRWGTDPTMFAFAYQKNGHQVPWFALDWAEEYSQLPEIDRVIRSIATLHTLSSAAYLNLNSHQKSQIHYLKFENLLLQPTTEIEKLQTFLNKPVSSEMPDILKREKLPNANKVSEVKKRLSEIKDLATQTSFKSLESLIEEYES
jgi:hypothetical protein